MLDVIIIGAGQAGLSMGYYLKKEGYYFVIFEGEKELEIRGETGMTLWFYLHLSHIVHCQG